MFKKPRRLAFLLIIAFAVTGCANLKPQGVTEMASINMLNAQNGIVVNATQPGDGLVKDYRLSIGDSLNIRFHQYPDLNTQVTVTPDGMIGLPLLNSIFAFGKTLDELTEEVRQAYQKLQNNAPKPGEKTYLIGIRDTLEVRFIYEPNFNTITTVRPDGRLSLPLIGSVLAEGKSVEELTQELENKYRPSLADPLIVIDIKSLAVNSVETAAGSKLLATPGMSYVSLSINSLSPQRIYVSGEVKTPGAVSYHWPMTAMQAVISAGGATQAGELREVVVLKRMPGKASSYIVRDLKTEVENAASNDILLDPSDVVVVPKTGAAMVQNTLEEYLYNIFPMLKNSSVSAMFIPYNNAIFH